MATRKLVVFDLDGTLNQTHLFSVPAHLQALQEFGIEGISEETIISGYGARIDDFIRQNFPHLDAATIQAYIHRASELEKDFIRERGKPYDGVPFMLQQLREGGCVTAVCSNASERYIRLVLDSLLLSPLIDEVQPLLPDMTKVETLRILLDRVAPSSAAMVGDRFFDKEAAEGNHIPFIGCLYGYAPQEVSDGDAAVHSASEIFAAAMQLL